MHRSPIAFLLVNIGVAGGLVACGTTPESSSSGATSSSSGANQLGPCPANETRTVSGADACRLARDPVGERALCAELCGRSFGFCEVAESLKTELGLTDAGADGGSDAGTDAGTDAGAGANMDAGLSCPSSSQTIVCNFSACPGGRNVAPFVVPVQRPENGGEHFAQMAELEQVSVFAFSRLGEELELLGAPRALIAKAQQAAIEEQEHARLMRELAVAYGASGVAPNENVATWMPRSLFDIAMENAKEGCVRESYGAVLAAYASHHARAPAVRKVMEQIAFDEAGHASWSWDLHAWALTKLSAEEQAIINATVQEARIELRAALVASPNAWWAEVGIPGPSAAAAMFGQMESVLLEGARKQSKGKSYEIDGGPRRMLEQEP